MQIEGARYISAILDEIIECGRLLLGLDPAVVMDEDVGTRLDRKRALGDVLTAMVEPLAKATAGALLTTEPPVTEVGLSALSLATYWLSPLMADTLMVP